MPGVRPGTGLVDVAMTLADGGECITHRAPLRQQPDLLGHVASTLTQLRRVPSRTAPPAPRLCICRSTRSWATENDSRCRCHQHMSSAQM